MEDRAKLERRIAGALRSTIDAHGPITKMWIGSATKRVVSEIKVLEREERPEAGSMSQGDGLGG
jgi:hypothetical protein